MPPGRERKVVSKRTMVPGAALLLVTSMTTVGATDTGAVTVLPMPLGEEETETVLAAPPPQDRSWISGDVDDPEGVLEHTAADYLWRSRSYGDALPGHAPLGFSGSGQCRNEWADRITCEQLGLFGCVEFACGVSPEGTYPIDEPPRSDP
jgi:hypothetical protein